jgi:hypothetical protein
MTETIRDWNPGDGDFAQGDVLIFRLPDGLAPSRSQPIAARDGKLILAEGEATGHHHAIWFNPPMFRDDGLARSLEAGMVGRADHARAPATDAAYRAAAEVPQSESATLYRDDIMTENLVLGGYLTTDELVIGYLIVDGDPVMLRHQEHDTVSIPPGNYYIGRQREMNAGEVRRVQD